MRIVVFGGSGRVGSLIVDKALSQGYSVTALAREASSLPTHPRMIVIEGSVANQHDVTRVFNSVPADDPIHAVLIALGASRANDSPWAKPLAPPSFLRDSTCHVLQAMRWRQVNKVVVLSAFGAGMSWTQFPWIFKLLFLSSNMKRELDDHNDVEQELRAAGEEWHLDWTIARPTILRGGEPMLKEFGETGKGIGVSNGASRQGVAQWMLDCISSSATSRHVVCLAG